ncbi:hypothetical protein A2Z00_01195 [Candidatus Gottesmanbacteria bacterium RBG_13_45_10]|uniref:TrpR like protein, YerC/YecD n=1 Tax=Candidatus Gottesmanbacteria bacterium RBG_13_45_10 TaxID=1798370 RepID=A0A1F5ZHR1_9BACT|nr:MAG: hypothetical protein A2Z00_01195 [Candidatus Gottesmanbacteria bacterium RBG_13_45_10]
MGRISRRHLNSVLEERIHSVFWEHIASLHSASYVKEFLQSLLSHTEQVMLAKRLAIAILLSRGYTYQKIDDTLKVSKATISTVHRQLLSGATGYKQAVLESNKRRSNQAMWDALEKFLLSISLPARHGSTKFQLKSEIGKGLRKRKFQRENIG